MKHTQTEMEAIAVTQPRLGFVMNPVTSELDEHLVYDAEVQYKRKDNQVRLIMCSSLDDVVIGEPVMITYHSGMRCYKHSRHVVTSSEENCIGGFYFTNGTPA
jgi:predicted metallo-beta-lactamase superfamily hydrolase